MYPWILALRFSVYLRRQWNISHFTVCIPLYLVPLVIAWTEINIVWVRTAILALAVCIVWLFVHRARLHNKPASVPSVISVHLSMFLAVLAALDVLLGHNVAIALCHTVAVIFAATPGLKVPHEPDNLNYAPEGA